MTDFFGISENEYEQIKHETMTHMIAQLYVDAYTDNHIAIQRAKEKLPDPLPAIYVHNIRQTAMDQFNTWMRTIKEQG